MNQQSLFDPVPRHRLESLSKEELIEFTDAQQKVIEKFQKEVSRLRSLKDELEQKSLLIEDQFITIKNKLFGKSSERSPRTQITPTSPRPPKSRVLLPSERYPNAPLIERDITLDQMPTCKCCGHEMEDSGLTEDSEFLQVIPQQYFVVRQKRHKYRCSSCHGDIKTAPAPHRIKEGSSYSDDMIVDVALSKYCDLIPIERYASIAGREGLKDLPPQSLIECTHNLADFLKPAYDKLQKEILQSKVLHADETPHRMLEGDKKHNWFLWGFSNKTTSYFECHDTRSGDIASKILLDSKCEHLVSDVFSGYSKAVRNTNTARAQNKTPLVTHVFCNAHARRKFVEAKDRFPEEAQFFIDQYEEIYRLESSTKGKPPDEILEKRELMRAHFEKIKQKAMQDIGGYSSKSSLGKAFRYFLENLEGLTRFLKNPELPIDNNPQERLLRNPVIGRKTWYGTHSQRGAETMAVLFSLVQSCKLNKINPRVYFKKLVQDLHAGKNPYSPSEFKNLSP